MFKIFREIQSLFIQSRKSKTRGFGLYPDCGSDPQSVATGSRRSGTKEGRGPPGVGKAVRGRCLTFSWVAKRSGDGVKKYDKLY